MLNSLQLNYVGPAPKLEVPDFGERLNIITGDNGLGKSFLLDVAWWALTREWVTPDSMARPSPNQIRAEKEQGKVPCIKAKVTGTSGKPTSFQSQFSARQQSWSPEPGRKAMPGLVIYARIDGSFAVWDPARNYWLKEDEGGAKERVPAYVFKPDEVWNGLKGAPERSSMRCNGLITDWMLWQKEGGAAFKRLARVLVSLSESEENPLKVGVERRVSLADSRDIPTMTAPWGEDIPLTQASAGVRRIVALAYFIVWSWLEHVKASQLIGETPTNRFVFLIDEIEAHLHPRWQRSILRGLLGVVNALLDDNEKSGLSLQIITTTHSPLILASMEPHYDSNRDRVWDFSLTQSEDGPRVTLERLGNVRYGDAKSWLGSPAFEVPSSFAIETDALIAKVKAAMGKDSIPKGEFAAIDAEMAGRFSDIHPVLAMWRVFAERKGYASSNARSNG